MCLYKQKIIHKLVYLHALKLYYELVFNKLNMKNSCKIFS